MLCVVFEIKERDSGLCTSRPPTLRALRLFYREAGDRSKPTIVLLHGFPSSYQFHDVIPRLADRFHVIALDYPGMGFSEAPAPTVLQPTFDDAAKVIDAFIAPARVRAPHLVFARHRRPNRNAHREGPPRADRRPYFSELHNFSGGLEPRVPESLRTARRPRNPREAGRDRAICHCGTTCFSTRRARASPTP